MKVLILSMSCLQTRERPEFAVKEYMESNIKGSSVIVINAREYMDPLVNKLVSGGILAVARNSPAIYDRIYNRSNDEETRGSLNKIFNDILSAKLKDLIDGFVPDIIISAHPFYLEILSILKKSGKVNIPVVALITDFTIHKCWAHDFLEAYVIPREDLKGKLISEGVDERRIFPLGIPISSEYLKPFDRTRVLKGLGLSEKKTLLIMSSSLDGGSVKNIFKALAFSDMDIQIIVVSGSSTRLKNQLENIARDCHKRVKIFGCTDRIPELMSASDILISKPLGHTLAKAMIKGLPAAIMPPVPGIETMASDYLVKMGAAICLEKNNMEPTLKDFINDAERLKNLKADYAVLSKPNAAADIASLAVNIINLSKHYSNHKQ